MVKICTRIALAMLLGCIFSPPIRAELTLAEELRRLPEGEAHLAMLCELALASEFGIPSERLRQKHPGFAWNTLSSNLLSIMQERDRLFASIPAALADETEVNAKAVGEALKVKDLAFTLMENTVPIPKELRERAESDPALKEAGVLRLLLGALEDWRTKPQGQAPIERARAWMKTSWQISHVKATSLILFLGDEELVSALGDDLSLRLKGPADPMLVLEAAALVRQRRERAADFWKQVYAHLQRTGQMEYSNYFCARGERSLLVEKDGFQKWMEGIVNGSEEGRGVGDPVVRSVDMHWDYHSPGIEPASMHLPVMKRNLVAILKQALAQTDFSKRKKLLNQAEIAAAAYVSIWQNVEKVDLAKQEFPLWSDAEWSETRGLLKKLLEGDGSAEAARAVFSLTEAMLPAYSNDWGGDVFRQGTIHELSIAREIIADDFNALIRLLRGPEKSLTESFREGEAVDWRHQMEALSWVDRLLLPKAISADAEFASRLWMRERQWVDWSGEGQQSPPLFEAEWSRNFAGKSLTMEGIDSLKEMLKHEALSGRFWAIRASSSIRKPGLELKLSRESPEQPCPDARRPGAQLLCRTSLNLANSLADEYLDFRTGKWEQFFASPEDEKKQSLRDLMRNVESIVPTTAKDGVSLEVRVFPGTAKK